MRQGRHIFALRLACTFALCLSLLPGPASAAPLDPQPRAADAQAVGVAITQPAPSVSSEGIMKVTVEVSLTAPAEYLEVRLRLRQPSAKLVYQKTEVRADLQAGLHTVSYEYDLGPLELEEGRYPIEVRVLATGSEATSAAGRLLVVDPDTDTLPVAIVVRALGVPSVAADGRFMIDPASDTKLRDELSFVTLLARDRRVPLSLAIPPVLLEQFGRVSAGYETTAGVVVPSSGEAPMRASRLLEALESTLDTGTVDLVDVPYALPDLARLDDIGADSDIEFHWSRTDAVSAAVLRSADRPTVAYIGSDLTDDALSSLDARRSACLLAPASALQSEDQTTTPGLYELPRQNTQVLVLDEEAAAGAYEGADAFYDALFRQLGGGPAVIMLDIGADGSNGALAVQNALDWIDEASWLRLVSLESLASRPAEEEVQPASDSGTDRDSDYWAAVGRGREAAVAYLAAAGERDEEAVAVLQATLVSESSLFELVERDLAYDGTAYAAEAEQFVDMEFSRVRLDTKDVTLSGTKGDVPLTLINDTGKPLNLTVRARSSTVLPDSPSQSVLAGPTQNFLTIPIDLGNTLNDTLYVEVLAGDLKITETTVDIRASYMDRLATILMVVLVLGGLLVFIRRRVMSTDAATIVADDERPPARSSGE